MKFDLAGALALPRLPAYLAQIQLALEHATTIESSYIQEPVTRIVAAPSKRLRSALAIAAAQGAITEKVIAACTAIELVHLGSLVHDDIMDNADVRWGIQTVHKREGTNQAILVGDYLFAKANQVAATVSPQLAELIATAIINLCDGQARELAAQYDIHRSLDSYFVSIQGKTASLFSAACTAGALAAGRKSPGVVALGTFGEAFGMSFQLLDDLLDFVSTPELLGKPTASDVREGVYTMPVLLALHNQNKQLGEYIKAAKNEPLNKAAYPYLQKPLQDTYLEIKKYNQRAQAALRQGHAELAVFPTRYTSWALSSLVADEHKAIFSS